jgi:ATP-dependent RNA helicase DeaD
MDFKGLRVRDDIIALLSRQGISQPTQIQELAIPLVMRGKDVVAQSKTGSGKTLAYAIPLVQNLKNDKGVKALIIAPTRELCSQIAKEIDKISARSLFIQTAYGGVSIEPQIRNMPYTDILVGAPGRLLDLINRRVLKLDKLQILVLDEGDHMFDMGFIRDIDKIIRATPKDRQTLLFSATVPNQIKHLIDRYMNAPQYIKPSQYVEAHLLKQYFYYVPHALKMTVMVNLLKNEKSELSLVFCSTKRGANMLTRTIRANGINVEALHGNISQAKRESTTNRFKHGDIKVVVATDLAARGLDINKISHVYNFNVPNPMIVYTHRIGRTARIGKEGAAISIVSENEAELFRDIYNVFRGNITELKVTPELSVPIITAVAEERRRFDSSRRNRQSKHARENNHRHSSAGTKPTEHRFSRPSRSHSLRNARHRRS